MSRDATYVVGGSVSKHSTPYLQVLTVDVSPCPSPLERPYPPPPHPEIGVQAQNENIAAMFWKVKNISILLMHLR